MRGLNSILVATFLFVSALPAAAIDHTVKSPRDASSGLFSPGYGSGDGVMDSIQRDVGSIGVVLRDKELSLLERLTMEMGKLFPL